MNGSLGLLAKSLIPLVRLESNQFGAGSIGLESIRMAVRWTAKALKESKH